MEERTASTSAAIIAAHRAMESAKSVNQRICHDPYAEKLIGARTTVIGESDIPRQQALDLFRQFVPGFHEYFLARCRYIDDYLAHEISRGLEQLVILGAGYDSRAYRFDSLAEGCRVFEVDHPATQAVKKERLTTVIGTLPEHVTFVPLDLQAGDLEGRMLESGYEPGLRTLFISEGVTMYLEPASVEEMLGFASANQGPGSSFIADVTSLDVVKGLDNRPEAAAWLKKAYDNGEPLRFGINFNTIESFLSPFGFGNITCVTHDAFKRTYFSEPGDDRESTPILVVFHGRVCRGKA